MTSPLANRNVAVLGGTGTFGKAFVQHALDVGVRRVVVFSRDELKQSELRAQFPDDRLRLMLGSVTDPERVERALRGVELVIHAAAMKQVPACEEHPWEAMQTNSIGAAVVTAAAINAGVERAVYLSTDKAAAPNTLYGATKLVGERIWIQSNVYAAGTRTRFVATRYGNVLGSRGSVIPLWRAQAAAQRPLTITSAEMTRFWMTTTQAVQLVEHALSASRGGEVWVPKVPSADMGTLAQAVAPDAEVEVIGIRRGEKLHETLVTEDESRDTVDVGEQYVIEPKRTWEQLPLLHGERLNGAYTSADGPHLGVDELRALIQEAGC